MGEGWGLPGRCKKWHYFRDRISLCGGWGFFGTLEEGNDNSPDNCASCRRKKLAEGGDDE